MDTLDVNNTIDNIEATVGWRPPGIVLTLVSAFLAIGLYELWFRNSHAYKTLRTMPGPRVLPLIGNAHLIFGLTNSQVMQRALEYLKEYGETVRGVLGNKCLVFLTNPDDIELILNSQQHLEKSEEYQYFQSWFGQGLLISKGDHWRLHRKIIAPTFHQSILKSFMPKFVEHSKNVADQMAKYIDGNSEFDVHDYMSQMTVEVLLSTVMGVRKLPLGDRCYQYAKAVMDMCHVIHRRQIELLYRVDAIYKWTKMRMQGETLLEKILTLTREVIATRKRDFNYATDSIVERCEVKGAGAGDAKSAASVQTGLRDDLDELDDEQNVGAKQRLALLDAMIELTKQSNIEWNDQDVVDEVNTIMFEGHDTTAAASSFVLCLLGIHQDIQARVLAEQREIFNGDLERDCTFSDTLEMHYLERVIKETLRLYPPVPIIARRVNEDVRLASGPYTIPRGCTVVLGQYAVHRRPDIYDNPDVFDPDNFLPDRVSKRHYYGYVPFSAGPRSCVGRKYAMLMLKVLLSTLLRRFQVQCDLREKDFKMQGDIILKLTNGFKIKLKKRI